jgi:hypothetical protein
VVRLALAIGFEATSRAGADPAELPTVFSSSGGDGFNCHEICQTLATGDRQLSPTRFHNSVHNAASGYWSIAAGATPPSSVLCAYDATFGAALLEALTQVVVDQTSVLLVAYDSAYPEPLHAVRPIPDAFGIAMVLSPVLAPVLAADTVAAYRTPAAHERAFASGLGAASVASAESIASAPPAASAPLAASPGSAASIADLTATPSIVPALLTATLTDALAESMADARLEWLRASIPAARCLPLLSILARQEPGRAVIDYLEDQRIAIEVTPWR